MIRSPLIIVGGGEHARVVADAARSTGAWHLIGFVDPHGTSAMAERLAAPHLGDDDALSRFPDVQVVLGVGALRVSTVRPSLVRSMDSARWASVVHVRAWVSPSASLAAGAFVSAGAMVQTGARLGAHVIVNTGAVVEHDVIIDDFAQIGPSATIGGGAKIGSGTFIGIGARIRDHVSVGSEATVAMGAVVVCDVAARARVAGVPAKPIR